MNPNESRPRFGNTLGQTSIIEWPAPSDASDEATRILRTLPMSATRVRLPFCHICGAVGKINDDRHCGVCARERRKNKKPLIDPGLAGA